MSNTTNDKLMDSAQDMLEYWAGTLWERIIQRDLDANDLEALHYHVAQAYKEYSIQEDGWVYDEVQ